MSATTATMHQRLWFYIPLLVIAVIFIGAFIKATVIYFTPQQPQQSITLPVSNNDQAFQNGYQRGHQVGYEAGKKDGEKFGKQESHDAAYTRGWRDGEKTGILSGYADGKLEGIRVGQAMKQIQDRKD